MLRRQSRRAAARVAIILIAVLSLSALAAPAGAVSSDEKAAAWRVNHERYLRHYRSLAVSESLSNLARKHSCEMAANQDLYHTVNLGSKVSGWRVLGENVGMGWNLYELHKAFMASPDHRDNILEYRYRKFGVGVCRDSAGTYYITNVFFA